MMIDGKLGEILIEEIDDEHFFPVGGLKANVIHF